ncbi:MAG: hypothetical protein PVH12_00320 [Candidatus Bathyarchaeota archaeon]|jgi:hypothetical protein
MSNLNEAFDNCFKCGRKLEKGYLRCGDAIWGWGWVEERKFWRARVIPKSKW